MTARPARVLHLLPDLSRGGGQVVVLELVTNCDRDRFEPHVARLAPPDDLAAEFTAVGCAPVDPRRAGPGLIGGLLRTIDELGIDLLHVHSEQDRKLGQMAALLKGVPVIGHLHSPWAHLEVLYPDNPAIGRRMLARAKASARVSIERRTVVHYIAVGDEVARFHRGRVSAPITVVNNGIDTQRFVPVTDDARLAARSELGLPSRAPVVGFVGRLAMGKGQDILIDMMEHLAGARLLLLGDGDQRGDLEAQAVALGVADRVVFAGDRADVASKLPAADVFAMASQSEGLPLSVLEAMACGIPVVSYDLAGLRDVITDGVEGRLVTFGRHDELASVLSSLLDDDHLRGEMGAAARDTAVRRFDSRVMAAQVQDVYDLVLSGHEEADSRRLSDVRYPS